jgi:LAS superfamily LD-carboxypeptidase LdcB
MEKAKSFGKPAGRIPIEDRVDPGQSTLVAINRYGETASGTQRVFYLTPDALAAFRGLRARALAEGFNAELFSLTSAYRSAVRQAQLAAVARAQYGSGASKWVAQTRSEHVTGRAFDLDLGIENSSANAKSRAFSSRAAFRWLIGNAADFGLNPYPEEPWHWSYNVVPGT